jgi:serine/threonine-protein kinase
MAHDDPSDTLEARTLERATDVVEPDSDATQRVVFPDRPFGRLPFAERYTESSPLGEGGMGAVLSCADRQIGRKVAMKVIRKAFRKRGDLESRFLREARVQGQLEHPSVVPVYDLGVDPDGAVYFTMKRVRGTTLEHVLHDLARGDWEAQATHSRRRLLTAFSSVCLAVEFAHRRGVLHRDLKPANVMLGDFGEVYVLDWGLARVTGQAEADALEPVDVEGAHVPTRIGSVLGTPGYMSPEQLEGRHDELGPASDVYSLGAILFELLTLEPLHRGSNIEALMTSTLLGAEARPSVRAPHADVPPELEAIVVRALERDPRDRFENARELSRSIERYLDGERDVTLRAELAAEHARAAREAHDLAVRGGELSLEHRRRAMQSIGRSLALDPTNEEALREMAGLLSAPPDVLPPEVTTEIASNERHKLRWVGWVGGFAYASVLVFLPLLAWAGVRDPLWVAIPFVFAAITSALSFSAALSRFPPRAVVLGGMVTSNLAFASTAALFGPLLLTPMMIAVNVTGYALNLDPAYRKLAIGTGVAAMLLPVIAWRLELLPGGYTFEPGALTIHAGAIEFSEIATSVVLLGVNLAALVIGAFSVTRVRDALATTERQVFLYAWHLREFVPASMRAATDPTAARRGRDVS